MPRFYNKVVEKYIDKFVQTRPIYSNLKIEDDGWELDTHSTILSRRHSYHKVVGKKRFVKVKKISACLNK
jgi:hypothetical protein